MRKCENVKMRKVELGKCANFKMFPFFLCSCTLQYVPISTFSNLPIHKKATEHCSVAFFIVNELRINICNLR